MTEIKLLLVDDHEVVRTSLKTFLDGQSGMEVVGEANSGEEAVRVAREVNPDVVVMDISMPGMDGLLATRLLKDVRPQTEVLALTIHDDKHYFFEMLSAGASGYLTKQSAAEELVAAIHTVAKGDVYMQPTLARWLLEDYRRISNQAATQTKPETAHTPTGKGLDVLSKRELQVLELVAEGMSNPQIGETLGISPKTVARLASG